MSVKIVQNDTLPPIEFTLTQDGAPVNLTGCTVKFYMKDSTSGSVKINGVNCTITDAAKGNADIAGRRPTPTRSARISVRSRSRSRTEKSKPDTSKRPSLSVMTSKKL